MENVYAARTMHAQDCTLYRLSGVHCGDDLCANGMRKKNKVTKIGKTLVKHRDRFKYESISLILVCYRPNAFGKNYIGTADEFSF